MDNNSQQKMALMEANNLTYKFDDVLNVSVNRTMKKQYFDTRTYNVSTSSQQAVSTWNSGVDLIDLRNSYLKFKFNIAAPAATDTFSFGSGSAMNVINEIKILSSSGIEIARTQDANVYHKFMTRSRHSSNWISSIGSVMGMDQAAGEMNNRAAGYVFCIPLSELDSFFELYDGKLLSANVASGLRIEITWENMNKVLVADVAGTQAPATSYTISEIEFRTECVTLGDNAMAILNKEAATNGLEITYDRVYTSSKTTDTTDENIEVRKAVSLCKSVYCISIPTDATNNQALDSFASAAYNYTSVETRLGNNHYPFQPIDDDKEAYLYFLKNFNKLKSISECSVDYQAFAVGGDALISANFETDDSLNLTGLPINSSRIVEVRFSRPNTTSVKTYIFLKYTALARASLTNVSVKI